MKVSRFFTCQVRIVGCVCKIASRCILDVLQFLVRTDDRTHGREKKRKRRKRKKDHLVAISWYYLHLPSEDAATRVQRTTFIPRTGGEVGGQVIPSYTRNLPVCISLFRG